MISVPATTPQRAALLRYNNGAILLHWLTVALLLVQLYVGFTFHDMPRSVAKAEWFTWHKTLGATILILSLIRLAWRLAHKPPPFPPELPHWERLAAVWNHRAFYALLIAVPLTGLAAVSGHGPATPLIGGLPLPTIPGVTAAAGDRFGDIHVVLIWMTIALVALHLGAALKHQFVDRARYAGRMPPFRDPRPEPVVPAEGS